METGEGSDSDLEGATECTMDYAENAPKRESIFVLRPGEFSSVDIGSTDGNGKPSSSQQQQPPSISLRQLEAIALKAGESFDDEKSCSEPMDLEELKRKCLEDIRRSEQQTTSGKTDAPSAKG